jgi:hypothetical protein
LVYNYLNIWFIFYLLIWKLDIIKILITLNNIN